MMLNMWQCIELLHIVDFNCSAFPTHYIKRLCSQALPIPTIEPVTAMKTVLFNCDKFECVMEQAMLYLKYEY